MLLKVLLKLLLLFRYKKKVNFNKMTDLLEIQEVKLVVEWHVLA